ncbi:putative lactoylglutathione lyase [Halanaerobium saccharolyticum]|jgi:predicted lactoylglutathione lyase|uniref:Putative lactoylglutathione lyase n=1 Tax=Halanaerobium saccharolyticum TaxID=43595 RepID=A0A2T5RGL0_9FIRM|nr:VOC family protein [Halanaerobium saccharolyticum]PTV93927.1 putative lactoylglutathione lyase [Halanaerobium saccharolyticum]TDP93101.1 putative lactoylglutathione lyase [Halanaerobium saccharolyticum]
MLNEKAKLVNACPIFISNNVKKTVDFYVEKLGFKFAEHLDKIDKFAAIYRDQIEIVVVEKKKGKILSNQTRYGSGYDAYLDTATLNGIDLIYQEFKEKGVKIINKPQLTDYGSYEFIFEDIDGRNIGVGLIKDQANFFEKSNYLND